MDNSFPIESPSMSRRQLLNFLTGAVVASTASAALYPVVKYFIPPTESGEGGAILTPKFLRSGI